MNPHNATHDYTAKDAVTKRWHDLKGAAQMTIFERQEQRRKQYEMMRFKKALWDLVKYAVPVGALILILWKYSNELQEVLR